MPTAPEVASHVVEGGGWVIRQESPTDFTLHEIPQYGGPEMLVGHYTDIDLARLAAQRLT